jgi:SpoVK/Ycf46/Vps4 family AAA+-type ATPase
MSRGQRQYLIAGKAELSWILSFTTIMRRWPSLMRGSILHAPNGTGKTALLETLYLAYGEASVANDEGRFCELH